MQYATTRTAGVLLSGLLAFCGTASLAMAQQSSSSNSAPQTQSPPDDNSFPSDVSHKAAADKKKAEQQAAKQSQDQQSADQQTGAKPAPGTDQNQPPASSGSDDNAFPEDASRKAAAARAADDKATKAAGDGSSDVPTSPGVSSSSDYDNRIGGGRNAVPTNVPMPHVNGKDPVKEDLNVGGYYLESGNYAGAYLRFKDATTLAPENMDAIFGLAESARHLKRRDEALANYQLFLQVVPSGSKVKDARKAVASLEKTK